MVSRQKWIWLARFAGLLISGVVLWRVFHLAHISVIAHTFKTMRPGWFIAAMLMYGMVFIPAAVRWHLVLKLSGAAVSPIVTFRYTLIGHFFYTFFFGHIGGDTAKVALYARRFHIPFARLLATAPLDRLLGTAGSVVFALMLLFVSLPNLKYDVAWPWLLALPLIAVALIALARLHFAACRSFCGSFLHTGRTLFSKPAALFSGISCSVLTLSALSAGFAFNLLAVSSNPLPLQQMFWTFPVIIAVSALPISIAGLGTREAAAMILLAPYGISAATAASASLLTFTAALIWALVGAMNLTPLGAPAESSAPALVLQSGKESFRLPT